MNLLNRIISPLCDSDIELQSVFSCVISTGVESLQAWKACLRGLKLTPVGGSTCETEISSINKKLSIEPKQS